jgi:hypothetical protein
MRRAILAALLVALLGCKGKPKGPVVAAAPKPAPEPISVPQTAVRLPPEQPIPPDAVAPEPAIRTPGPTVELEASPPAPKPVTRTRAPRAAPPRPAPAEAARASPEPPPPEPAPPLRPVLSPEQERDLLARIDRSLASVRDSLARAGNADRQAAARIQAFVEQANQARRQGDLNRARSLAERAATLAADLARTSR